MSSNDSPSLLSQDSNIGLVVRAVLFVVVMGITLGVLAWIRVAFSIELEPKWMLAMFLIVAVPMLVGLVLSEVPRGEELLLLRLGVATFCRTGLPLLFVIIVSQLAEVKIAKSAVGFLAVFYVIGFLASVWISVGRLKIPGSKQEVDRAVV
ncbi:MAG: hypothetical protein AB8B55_22525 [Mariniblastus sp.]